MADEDSRKYLYWAILGLIVYLLFTSCNYDTVDEDSDNKCEPVFVFVGSNTGGLPKDPASLEMYQIAADQARALASPSDGLNKFCTCDPIISKDCTSTEQRLADYNSGKLTETTKFGSRPWTDVMPYDRYMKVADKMMSRGWTNHV